MPLVLKTAGEDVSGTMTGPDGTEAPIKGTFTNDELIFTVTINAPPGPIDLQMKGQVSGGDIAGSFSGGPITGSFTAKRAQ